MWNRFNSTVRNIDGEKKCESPVCLSSMLQIFIANEHLMNEIRWHRFSINFHFLLYCVPPLHKCKCMCDVFDGIMAIAIAKKTPSDSIRRKICRQYYLWNEIAIAKLEYHSAVIWCESVLKQLKHIPTEKNENKKTRENRKTHFKWSFRKV